MLDVIKNAMQPGLAIPAVLFFSYFVFMVYLAASRGLWDSSLTTETAVWILGPGLGLLFATAEISSGRGSIKLTAKRVLAFTVVLEVYANLFVFSFPIEFLIVIPLTTFLVLLSLAANADAHTASVGRATDVVLSMIGVAIFITVTVHLNQGELGARDLAMTFGLPIWLAIYAIPLVFFASVVFAYQGAYRFSGLRSDRSRQRLQLVVALAVEARFNLVAVSRFRLPWMRRAMETESYSGKRAIVSEYIEKRRVIDTDL